METGVQYPENYISFIQDGEVRAEHVTPKVAPALRAHGAIQKQLRKGLVWVFNFTDEASLGQLLGELRDMGFLFVDEPGGWPPAAIFDELRGKGLVHGEFQAVTWRRPGDWMVWTR